MKRLKELLLKFAMLGILGLVVTEAKGQSIPDSSVVVTDTAQATPRVRAPQLLFAGVVLHQKSKKRVWYTPSIFDWLPYNTVEGLAVNAQLSFTQIQSKGKFFTLTPTLRYGMENQRFQAHLRAKAFYRPKRNAQVQIAAGRQIQQFNAQSTLSAYTNTLRTVTAQENFIKLYERTSIEIDHFFAPAKHWLLSTTVSWNERRPLQNLSRFESDPRFTSNEPINLELQQTAFSMHQAAIIDVQLRWQIGHHLVHKRGKLVSQGKYPAVILKYSQAIKDLLGSDLSYQKAALQITDAFKVGQGKGEFMVEAGDFLSKEALSFIDYKHFNGKLTVYGEYELGQFQLLDYYNLSTSNFYFQGHYNHHFRALKPNGKKSKFQPVVGINYLNTKTAGSIYEVGIGMRKVLKVWRVDLYSGWQGQKHENLGIRIGVELD